MASAILPSRNEPRSSDFMSKFSNNGNRNFTRFQNITSPNPNPIHNQNPNSSHYFIGNTSRDVVLWGNHERLPTSAPPQAAFAGSSINSVPASSFGYRHVTFRLGSYTRRELKELKMRLMSDLKRVRVIRHWISSTQTPKKKYHTPQLELPAAPSVALTGKERPKSTVGQKRAKPSTSVRDAKKQCGRVKNNAQMSKVAMRKCGQMLGKLMKHKHGWVFKTPVDAAALKLYDYHSIINKPMDLGTIKSKLVRNEYESPLAFASDVRLTFQNAMAYNGKGSDVFVMAERLLLLFEDMFNPTKQKLVANQTKRQYRSAKVPIPKEKPLADTALVSEKPVSNVTTSNPVAPQVAANLPEMTADERSWLADCLMNMQLEPEGMTQIMAIVRKGVYGYEHVGDGDEVELELDLGVLDNETLWGLHRFISNISGKKTPPTSSIHSPAIGPVVEEEGMNWDCGEEDVDIGEEMQLSSYHCVEIERDVVNVSDSSSSCSSSSDSDSSSSGSGSGSSSGDEGNGSNKQEANSTPKCGSMGM